MAFFPVAVACSAICDRRVMGQRLCFGACDMVRHALATKGAHANEARSAYVQLQFQTCIFESPGLERYIHAEFQKLGQQDVTIIVASGDWGLFSGRTGGDLDSVICSQMGMSVYPTCAVYVFSVGGTKR